jgi:hypothetical protein
MRRWVRARRRAVGLCLSCGYDLAGNASGVCPECGTPAGPDAPDPKQVTGVAATLWSALAQRFTGRSGRRALVTTAVVLLLLVAAGVAIVVANRPEPPTFYPQDKFLRLSNYDGYTLYTPPTIAGPYRSIGAAVGAKGESVSGKMGYAPYSVAGVPNAWVMAVGIVNPGGQCGVVVLLRYDEEEDAGAATQPAER